MITEFFALMIFVLGFAAGAFTRHKLDGLHDWWRYGRKSSSDKE